MESVCCIYHKARKFGESSSEEPSSDSDSDSDCNHGHRRHQSANGNGGGERERDGEGAQIEELESDDEPNAYERPPGWKKNKGKTNANG